MKKCWVPEMGVGCQLPEVGVECRVRALGTPRLRDVENLLLFDRLGIFLQRKRFNEHILNELQVYFKYRLDMVAQLLL